MLIRLLAVATSCALSLSCAAFSAQSAASHDNVNKRALALQGFDPVAYFEEGGGAPIKGKPEFEVWFEGALYRFESEANRELFLADPERFEPRFGGWCAWAMIEGDKVEVDPQSFLIENGSLLLFYDGWLADTRKLWLKQGGDTVRPTADANWLKLTGEFPPQRSGSTLALGGFDPVSFFANEAPVAGESELETRYGGRRYRFATKANRIEFLKKPARVMPRYDGHAALALAGGVLRDSDPEVFALQADALFLFVDSESRDAWVADSSKRAAADRHWAELESKSKGTR